MFKHDEVKSKAEEVLDPITPGEILLEEFIKPFKKTINAIAK